MRIMTLISGMLMSGVAWAAENPLAPEIGQTRPLVVVTLGASDLLVSELHQALASPATVTAFAERQIVVFTVIGGHGARAAGRSIDNRQRRC